MNDLLLGYQLGSYRLIEILGQGSFAQVYRGQHVHLGVFAAVKVLHAQLGEQEKQNFHKEAVLLTTLKHARIIRFLDYGFVNGRPYLITDLAERGSLNRIYPRGTRLPLPQIVSYVEQIADGLDFAHSQHIVHRDIKPENILVSDNGELLLADFGIAKLLGTSGSYLTGSMTGTLPYMAPELFDGRPSPPSDQYAVGVMVYEWLTGRFPFDGTAGELIKHHLQDPPPPLRVFNPSLSPEVEAVVLMALRKEPEQRFRSVRAFANAIRNAAGMVQQPSQPLPQVKLPQANNPGVGPASPVVPPQPAQRPASSPSYSRIANAVRPPSSRPPLPSDPAARAGGSGIPTPVRPSRPDASGVGERPPVSTDPSQPPLAVDPSEWQKLMPAPQPLPFTELPGLPQARLTDFWWPTFIIAAEVRRQVNQGTVLSEVLGTPGPLTSFPSLSVALPVSNSVKPPSIGKLDSAQRISDALPISEPQPAPAPEPAPAPAQSGAGRTAQPLGQPQAQPAPPKPVGRTASAAKAGASTPGTPGSSGAVAALVITVMSVGIGIICTSAGGSTGTPGAVIASWVFVALGFLISIIGIAVAKKSQTAVIGWLTFFMIVAFIMLFVNIGVYQSAVINCTSNCL